MSCISSYLYKIATLDYPLFAIEAAIYTDWFHNKHCMLRGHDLSERTKTKIQEIERVLETVIPQGKPLSLMGGPCGSILYYFYMSKMRDSSLLYDKAFDLLEHTLDFVEHAGIDTLTYCDGLVGFGTLFQLLAKEEFIDTKVDDVLLALDGHIVKYTNTQLQLGNLDFLHGALGNGFYLVRRIGTPATDQCLAYLIDYLSAKAISDAQGIRWHDQSSSLNVFKSGAVDLGLAHGLSGKLVFLAQCVKANVKTVECTALLAGGLRFLQHQAHPKSKGNVYPLVITAATDQLPSNRLAWCYGDLCIATAFLAAGKALNNVAWAEHAFRIALRAAKRITPDRTALVDAGLCHGTAGVAHIFNR